MTALEAVSAYVPPTVLPIEAICGPDGLPEAQAKVKKELKAITPHNYTGVLFNI